MADAAPAGGRGGRGGFGGRGRGNKLSRNMIVLGC